MSSRDDETIAAFGQLVENNADPAAVLRWHNVCLDHKQKMTISALRRGKIEKLNINLWGNGISSVHGHFAPGVKSTDFLNTGANFGIAWQYFPLRNFGVQAAYEFGWQNVANKYRNTAGQTPAFAVHQIKLSGLYNFANVIGPNSRFRPYVGAGLGVYPFRLTQDGVSGDVEKLANNNNFEKTSFGLKGSAGVEFQATIACPFPAARVTTISLQKTTTNLAPIPTSAIKRF